MVRCFVTFGAVKEAFLKVFPRIALASIAWCFSTSGPEAMGAPAQARHDSSIVALEQVVPGAAWRTGLQASADVTCDGHPDFVSVARAGNSVWFGIVPGQTDPGISKPITVQFSIGPAAQDSFCAMPVRIETSPIECDADGAPLPGCKVVKGCSALSVVDDECDSFHAYWNANSATVSWWRR